MNAQGKSEKKKRSWAEIKATKPIEEWRRINRIYDSRRRLKRQLKMKGIELITKISNYRIFKSPGPADALIDEVKKALRLPYSWGQEEYDHAMAQLNKVAEKAKKIHRLITPPTSGLANMLLMAVVNSKDDYQAKAAAVMCVVEHMASQISSESVDKLPCGDLNFLMTMLRTQDGHYPKWMEKYFFDAAVRLFSEEDLRKLSERFSELIQSFDDRERILNMLGETGDELGENDFEI